MAKKNRPSQAKREREFKRRERQQRKSEKAAEKRERRFGQMNSDAETLDDMRRTVADPPAEDKEPPPEP